MIVPYQCPESFLFFFFFLATVQFSIYGYTILYLTHSLQMSVPICISFWAQYLRTCSCRTQKDFASYKELHGSMACSTIRGKSRHSPTPPQTSALHNSHNNQINLSFSTHLGGHTPQVWVQVGLIGVCVGGWGRMNSSSLLFATFEFRSQSLAGTRVFKFLIGVSRT